MMDFFTSTKLPTRTRLPNTDSGRKWAKGPNLRAGSDRATGDHARRKNGYTFLQGAVANDGIGPDFTVFADDRLAEQVRIRMRARYRILPGPRNGRRSKMDR